MAQEAPDAHFWSFLSKRQRFRAHIVRAAKVVDEVVRVIVGLSGDVVGSPGQAGSSRRVASRADESARYTDWVYDSLTEEQQQWIRDAARQAAQATGDAINDETAAAQQLCAQGVRFYQAGPDQIRMLQVKVQPVIDALAADPTSGPLLKEIPAIAAKHPAPDVPIVPANCAPIAGPVPAN